MRVEFSFKGLWMNVSRVDIKSEVCEICYFGEYHESEALVHPFMIISGSLNSLFAVVCFCGTYPDYREISHSFLSYWRMFLL